MKDALYEKFSTVLTRPGRGGSYPYIKWQDVANRMNNVFGTDWSSEAVYQEIIGSNIVVRVRVTITVPETNKFIWQEGYGGAPNDDRNEAGNAFKSAYSKALKDACKKWGIGLYLDEEGESDSSGSNPPPAGYIAKETAMPSVPLPMPNNTKIAEPKPPVDEVPTQHVVSTPNTSGMPLPPGIEMEVKSGITIAQVDEAAVPIVEVTPPLPPNVAPLPVIPPLATTPNISVPPAVGQQVNLKEDMPMTKTTTINTGEPTYISDVQKAALQSILSIKEAEYDSLAREAFEANGVVKTSIPEPDKLTYQEAVFVVKYGNDKFRRR